MFYLVNLFAEHEGVIHAALFQKSDFWTVAVRATDNTFQRALIVSGFAAVVVLDTYLSWNIIVENWDRMRGVSPKAESSKSFFISPSYVTMVYRF